MYFANNAGVLESDGRTWRLIELPSASTSAGSSRIHADRPPPSPAASTSAPPATSATSRQTPPANCSSARCCRRKRAKDKTFDHIFTPAITRRGIAFQARTRICRWDDVKLTYRDAEPALSRIFQVRRTELRPEKPA